jgi:inorganic triphosphatase YgiF
MHNGQESELTFIIAPGDLSKVEALPLIKEAWPQAQHQRLISTYFDTPERYLWQHGVSLRVRQTTQGLVQTLKQQKASALERGEWEEKITQNIPDMDAVSKTPLAPCFKKRRVRERLHRAIGVDVERVSSIISVGQSRIEVAIDQGSVEAQGRPTRIWSVS